jgi:CheY-like chemotaxis protein
VNAVQEPRYVFISYVREDVDRVTELAQALREEEIPVWLDIDNLSPGQIWLDEIRRAIKNDALVFIACFSHNSRARTKTVLWEELNMAVEQLRLRPPGVPWLIPVRLDDGPVPDLDIGGGRTLESVQRVDIFGNDAADGMARLIRAVQSIRSQSSAKAPLAAATVLSGGQAGGPKLLFADPHYGWHPIVERAARPSFRVVESVHSLEDAEYLIDRRQFAVALVEVGLGFHATNADGLRLMEKIRAAGDDATSIILFSARADVDVSDAFRKYRVFDGVTKSYANPRNLRMYLDRGLAAYQNALPQVTRRAPDVLRGGQDAVIWDDEMLRYIAIPAGISYKPFMGFLVTLFGEFLPAIPLPLSRGLTVDARLDAASGLYWSRALGQAVLVCLGAHQAMDRLIAAASSPGALIPELQLGDAIKTTVLGDLKGAIFPVHNVSRGDFRT